MIASLSLILLCQLAGEAFVHSLELPMPGPVVGLTVLLVLLLARDRFAVLARGPMQGEAVEFASHGLLANLSLPFVPAGTAPAFQVDAVAGVFAGIAMSLNALLTSLLVPLAVTFLLR